MNPGFRPKIFARQAALRRFNRYGPRFNMGRSLSSLQLRFQETVIGSIQRMSWPYPRNPKRSSSRALSTFTGLALVAMIFVLSILAWQSDTCQERAGGPSSAGLLFLLFLFLLLLLLVLLLGLLSDIQNSCLAYELPSKSLVFVKEVFM